MNLKNIHIGQIIHAKVEDQSMTQKRILNYFDCDEQDLHNMYNSKSLDTDLLLKWCKLLKVDLFRMFVAHLAMYHAVTINKSKVKQERGVGEFRKNVYSVEVRNFVLQQVKNGNMSITDIISKYNIPRTTIYTWIRKNR
jgi:Helix-turn-helix domain